MGRFLFGVIVGALLVVGGAYYHDTKMMPPKVANAPAPLPYVNWDQVIQAFGGR
jgi:hypothetical protein